MGKTKYLQEIEALFSKSPVVSYSSIYRAITSRKKVKQYAKRMVHHLIAKGRIKRLAKGYYTAFDDASLAVFCFQPAYLGLQDALSFHNLWEQETVPVLVTTRKVRPGMRCILGTNVLVRRIERKYFFGFEYKQEGNAALPYSDMEKTFLDMVYFKERLGRDVIAAFKERIDMKKLRLYLKKYSVIVRKRALSCIA